MRERGDKVGKIQKREREGRERGGEMRGRDERKRR